jgi:hypothetical protein
MPPAYCSVLDKGVNFFFPFFAISFVFRVDNTAAATVFAQILLIAVAIATIQNDIDAAAFRTDMSMDFGDHFVVAISPPRKDAIPPSPHPHASSQRQKWLHCFKLFFADTPHAQNIFDSDKRTLRACLDNFLRRRFANARQAHEFSERRRIE